jgi:hypothetical protein
LFSKVGVARIDCGLIQRLIHRSPRSSTCCTCQWAADRRSRSPSTSRAAFLSCWCASPIIPLFS